MRNRFILSILSALLLIFTFPKFNLAFLAWVALIPLFFALENKNLKQKFAVGYLFGIIFFSGILYWLANVTIPGAIALILISSLYPAIFCSLYSSSVGRRLLSVVFVPAAWVLSEYVRAHFLSGFPWALLGYSQSFNLPVIQIADITGPYGVSFLIILVNFGIYLAIKKAPKRFYILFFIILLFVSVVAYGQNRIRRIYPTQNLKIALIQGNIPQDMKWDPRYREFIIDKYASLTQEALREEPGLIIWPETSVPGYLEEEPDLKNRVTNLARAGKAYLLAGTLREENAKIFNSATLISDNGKIIKSYDKIHLVPFGEFIPFERFIFWARDLIDKPIGDFDKGGEFTVFDFRVENAVFEPAKIRKTTEFYKFSSLICFEDIFPGLSRNFVKKGARFLVNMTNDAWFGKSAAPDQHAQGSVFRAVENRVPVLRAANTGLSCVIDHRGKILKCVEKEGDEIFVEGYLTETIRPVFANTIYTRFGDVFSWICIAFVGTGLFLKLRLPDERPVPTEARRHLRPKLPSLILAIFIVSSLSACNGEEIHYRGKLKLPFSFGKKYDYNNILVTRVIDGDTIELENRERVRLIGIDTPEAWYGPKLERDRKRTKQDYKTIMQMGRVATDVAKTLAEGKRVRLEFDIEKRDRYGRLLAYVYLPDSGMLNARLLKEGYAQIYTFPPNVKYVDMFLEAEKEARDNKRGFWSSEEVKN